ncbi:hypothetical protein [Rhodovulum steppense]|uniref:hypothetical protein n=1 Tax=Rhodovulum steppense TaxID=540251 RepID=UPI001404AFB0|nr:hypothetical protein [Rhodovulum steppense]
MDRRCHLCLFLAGQRRRYRMLFDAQDIHAFVPNLADVTADFLAANAPYHPVNDGRIATLGHAPSQ